MEIEDENNQQNQTKYYITLASQMKYNSKYTLEVDFNHIKEWSAQQINYDLSKCLTSGQEIVNNYIKYEPYLHESAQTFMKQIFPEINIKQERYFLSIKNLDSIQKIRDMKTLYIGKLGKALI